MRHNRPIRSRRTVPCCGAVSRPRHSHDRRSPCDSIFPDPYRTARTPPATPKFRRRRTHHVNSKPPPTRGISPDLAPLHSINLFVPNDLRKNTPGNKRSKSAPKWSKTVTETSTMAPKRSKHRPKRSRNAPLWVAAKRIEAQVPCIAKKRCCRKSRTAHRSSRTSGVVESALFDSWRVRNVQCRSFYPPLS